MGSPIPKANGSAILWGSNALVGGSFKCVGKGIWPYSKP